MESKNITNKFKLSHRAASLDADYGPFSSVEDALSNIEYERRAIGKTIAVMTEEGIIEYQFKSGIENDDLVEKNGESGEVSVVWSSILEKPTTFPPSTHSHAWGDITGKPSTFTPTIGTTATTAKAGNYVPTWAEVTNKPATFAPVIGTTSTTAKAGNYTPTTTEIVTAINAMTPEQVTAVQTKLGITPA